VIGIALALAVGALAQAPEPAQVWAVGDGADGSRAARLMAQRIDRADPDRFLYLGDVYPNGTARDFRRNYETTYGPLADITVPTAGNHEWANRMTGYFPYWRDKHGERPADWESFELGGWEILKLNSQLPYGPGSPQLRWLRRQLTEPGTCRLAFWHVPRFAARGLHGDTPSIASIWRVLRGHARIVVNGHEHSSQRFKRREGITQYIAGSGSEIRYRVHGRDPRTAFARGDVTAALKMSLSPGRARLEFRMASGRRIDTSRASCEPLR
jgi:calcineurin-like phosphoesterase family protein